MAGYIQFLGSFGGHGGGAWDDLADLKEKGRCLGYGARGLIASGLEVHHWSNFLSRTKTSYRPAADPHGEPLDSPSRANISCDSPETIAFHPHERVSRVVIRFGGCMWAAGAACLNSVVFTMQDVCNGTEREHLAAGRTEVIYEDIRDVTIPDGFTVAGFCGRSGDSLDQLGLYICPWVPKTWTPAVHPTLPPPFQAQVAALLQGVARYELPRNVEDALAAALFQATFYEGLPGVQAGDPISSWCRQQAMAALDMIRATDILDKWGVCAEVLTSDDNDHEEEGEEEEEEGEGTRDAKEADS